MSDVLLVTPYYDPNIIGGAEVSTQLIAEGLPRRCDILTFGPREQYRERNGVSVYEICLPVFANLWAQPLNGNPLSFKNKLDGHLNNLFPCAEHVKIYRQFFESHDYKVIIMNSNENVMGRPSLWKAAHESGARVILTLRDNMLLERKIAGIDYGRIYRGIVRRQLAWVDEIVAPSKYIIDLYAAAGMAKLTSRVIPNAVKSPDVNPVPFVKKRGVLFAGALTRDKGVPLLLAASGTFTEANPLTMIGRGPLLGECQTTPGVTVRDWMPKEELYRAMAGAKVLVLPSVWPEAFGRVLVEAVACGTLVIGSTAGGIPEVLSHDDRYLFEKGDIDELIKKVDRIIRLDEDGYADELTGVRESMRGFKAERYVKAWETLIGRQNG